MGRFQHRPFNYEIQLQKYQTNMRLGTLLTSSTVSPTADSPILSTDALLNRIVNQRKQYLPSAPDSPLFSLNHEVSEDMSEDGSNEYLIDNEATSDPEAATLTETLFARNDFVAAAQPEARRSGALPGTESEKQNWEKQFRLVGPDWSLRRMDEIWNASFYEFVKDEENVECIARHLLSITKDYKVPEVANGLSWLVKGWSIENIAKLLRFIFQEWQPDRAAYVVGVVSTGWPLTPDLSLLLAFMLNGESPAISAIFLRRLTMTWNHTTVTKLISYLDTVLEWDDEFFREFTHHFITTIRSDQESGVLPDGEDPDALLEDLAELYKANLAVTNWRLMMANFRLAVAEYNLNMVTHCLSCNACRGSQPCEVAAKMTPPKEPENDSGFKESDTDLGNTFSAIYQLCRNTTTAAAAPSIATAEKRMSGSTASILANLVSNELMPLLNENMMEDSTSGQSCQPEDIDIEAREGEGGSEEVEIDDEK